MKRHPTKAPALALLALALSACGAGTSSSATTSSSQQSQGSSSAPTSSSKSETKFTVTWKNEDGSVLETDTDVADGAVPVYDGAIPTKAGDAAKSYRFVGWTPTVAAIHADATYTARFVEVPNKYTVTWKNYDGTVLSSGDVAYGEVPAYSGTPSRPADEEYDYYDFKGWDKEVVAVTEAATYNAVFEGHKGKRTNPEEHDYASLKVNGPTNELADDFAFGVDLSMVADVEANGGVYYNEKGDEQDVFEILAADGVNYARLRLWNDPRNAQGAGYGGGNNDLLTDIALAKRAKAAGMKVLLDFHYSDFWVDPIHNQKPKAWHDLTNAEIPAAVKAYTKESLQAFKNDGITIDSVQIGNESNSAIAGVGRDDANFAEVFAQGIAGAKEVFPEIKTIVHLTQTSGNYNSAKTVLAALNTAGVAYDVIGLSYYPYEHGSQGDFFDVVNELEGLYNKPVIIAETSYGFTGDWIEGTANLKYWPQEDELPGGYVTGEQGQATLLGHLVDGLSKVANKHGAGIFYWGGDWLPVKGAVGSTEEGDFYQNHGYDGKGTGYLNNWANQALFSYTGKVLPSASTYKHIQDKDRTLVEADDHLQSTEANVNVDLLAGQTVSSQLPAKAAVVSNLNALHACDIVWNASEVSAAETAGEGNYEIHGTVTGPLGSPFEYVAHVNAFATNLILDGDFALQTAGSALAAPWTVNSANNANLLANNNEAMRKVADKYVAWWGGSDLSFDFSQTVSNLETGNYGLRFTILSADQWQYDHFNVYYQIEGSDRVNSDVKTQFKSWDTSAEQTTVDIEVAVSAVTGKTLTIGFEAVAVGESWANTWGRMTDILL